MNRFLFLNLTAFTQTGGIEKFNKCFLKALTGIKEETSIEACSYSAYDTVADSRYFDPVLYKGFKGKRIAFVLQSILYSRKFNYIILAHLNLAIIGWVIKKVFPKKKIIIITHGIEVLQPLAGFKKYIIDHADMILTVSEFTKSKLTEIQKADASRIRIFNNAVDPYFSLPSTFGVNNETRKKYGLKSDDKVMFTLTRMASNEQYKGYDIVLQSLPGLLNDFPNLKYVISGKYDMQEKARVNAIIKENGLEDVVTLTGFIDDSELIAHYQMADLFIMPSRGEGFGIVFIEAMACGLMVIAGNEDGSTEALRNGELGILVNPRSIEDIQKRVADFFHGARMTEDQKDLLQKKTLQYFGFDVYKERLKNILHSISIN